MCARSDLIVFAVAASALCGAVGASWPRDEDDGEHVKWVRMCTLTSRGGSAINATVPCGVRVRDESAVREEGTLGNRHDSGRNATVGDDGGGDGGGTLDDGALHANVSADIVAIASTTDGDRAEEVDSGGEEYDYDDDDDDGGVTVVEAQDDGVTVVEAQDDGGTVVEAQDDGKSGGGHDATVDKTAKPGVLRDGDEPSEVLGLEATVSAFVDEDYSATVVRDGPVGHQEHQRHGAVAKALLGYLLEARNRLHDKIHDLLNFLQNTFFNAKLYHRSRRNLAEQQMTTNGRRQGNKKKQSMASVILEPTFERSLMTMSFLMFGVFVIQVVQRLMQTLQQSGEMTSMGNPVFGNIPTISSNVF